MKPRRPRQSPIQPSPRRATLESEFLHAWKELFGAYAEGRRPPHLDALFSKLDREFRGGVARTLPQVLRRPSLVFEGVEIWSEEARDRWMELGKEAWSAARRAELSSQANPDTRGLASFGVREDFPSELLDAWAEDWGVQTAGELCAELRKDPGVHVRCVRAVQPREPRGELSPRAICFGGFAEVGRALEDLGELGKQYVIQDQGSQVLAWTALWPEVYGKLWGSKPGAPAAELIDALPADLPVFSPKASAQTWIEVCAGAGGRPLALADGLGNRGRIYAYDVSEKRLLALKRRAREAGYTCIQTARVDEEGPPPAIAKRSASADGVWIDAPCSGWGVLRRTPDVKWFQSEEELARLPEVQFKLLAGYAGLVKPGGKLVYSTCTFRRAEAEVPVARFLATELGREFAVEVQGYLGPGEEMDGFSVAVLRRKPS